MKGHRAVAAAMAGLLTLGACHGVPTDAAPFGRPTVILPGQGEERLMRGTRPLYILADPITTGSRSLVVGYEDVPPGDSGHVHRHLHEDETILVQRGTLMVILGDSTYAAPAGAAAFIPRGTWVGFRNAGPDTAGFFFAFNAPAFERCLRALSVRRGETFYPMPAAEMTVVDRACDWEVKGQ